MNKTALEDAMRLNNLSITDMYKALGLSRSAFYRKCNGKSEFTACEIKTLASFLGKDSILNIFFS